MKKSLRLISLLLAALFLISGSLMVICAAEGEDEGGGYEGGGGDSGYEGGGDSGYEGGGESGGDSGYEGGGESGGGDSGYSGGGDSSYSGGGDSSYSGGSDSSYNSGGYSQEYDDDPIYYGDASNYSYNISDNEAAGSVSSNTTLYNSSGMTAEDAAPNEWSEITLDEKTVTTGITDFSAIKSNTEVQDNGDWILYLGYVLIALSALGILYFIVATIAQSHASKKAAELERRRASRPNDRERRSSAPQRTSRFADEPAPRSRRTSSRSDTGEVYVPRRTAARRSR